MTESMSVDVTGLNRAAARLLRREASLAVRSVPPLLQLARWGMDNLSLPGPWELEREAMEGVLLYLERNAHKAPDAVVRSLAEGGDPAAAIQPDDLGPTLADAAGLVQDQLYYMVVEPIPD